MHELDLVENTHVLFMSNNGPWLPFKHHGGSAGPLRGGKFETFEGGHRVPCIVWAPGRIPAGTECGALASTIDLLPSIAALTGTPLPDDLAIDGMDISALLTGDTKSPREEFLYYNSRGQIEGIREGDWKLLVKYPLRDRVPDLSAEPDILLFHLAEDLGERNNLGGDRPELLERLRQRMLNLDAGIGAGAGLLEETKSVICWPTLIDSTGSLL